MVKISELKDTLGVSVNGVKDICTTPFINPFSKRKPIEFDSNTYVDTDVMKSANYGITPVSSSTLQGLYNIVKNNSNNGAINPYNYFGVLYNRPTNQYRLSDFIEYDHKASNPAPNNFPTGTLRFTIFGDDDAALRYPINEKINHSTPTTVGYEDYFGENFKRCIAFISGDDVVLDWCSDYINFKKVFESGSSSHNTYKLMEFVCELQGHKEIGEQAQETPNIFYALPVAINTFAYIDNIYSINGFNPNDLPNTYFKGELEDEDVTFNIDITLTDEELNGEVDFGYSGGLSVGYSTDVNAFYTGMRADWYEVANIYDNIWFGTGDVDVSNMQGKDVYVDDVLYTNGTLHIQGWLTFYYDAVTDSYRYYKVDGKVLHITKTFKVRDIQVDLERNGYVVLGLATFRYIIRKVVIGEVYG